MRAKGTTYVTNYLIELDVFQVFHFCQKDGRRDSFICPKGTVFNQALSHCDWWYNVKCG
jgi:hypothetical protein